MNMNMTDTTTRTTTTPFDELINDRDREILLTFNFAYFCQLIDVFGTVTNIINIINFLKQGFADPVNISFFALSISDLVSLIALLWNNLCMNPLFYYLEIAFDPFEMVNITAGWPHVAFARISACIKAFITTERCLCIVYPLKIKTMITRKRVIIIIIVFYVVLLASVAPIYYANQFSWKFYKQDNRSNIQLDQTSDHELVEAISYAFNNVAIACLTFIVIIVTTAILVVKLKQKAKWRMQSTAQGKSDSFSNRDRKISKMVVMMAAIFISCYAPVCVLFIAMIIEPQLSVYGKWQNIYGAVFSYASILESISVSANIFIYYQMSSRYRAVFRRMFCQAEEKSKKEKNVLAIKTD